MLPVIKYVLCVIVAHTIAWLVNTHSLLSENNGKKVWLCLMGVPITFLYMSAVSYGYEAFGKLWTVRLVGFFLSTTMFAILTASVLKEYPTWIDGLCLLLGLGILLLQIYKQTSGL